MSSRPLRVSKKLINTALAALPYWSWKFSYDFNQSHRIVFYCNEQMDAAIDLLYRQNITASECNLVKHPHDGSLVVSFLDFQSRAVTVYGLVDPLSQQIRYIGQTVNVVTRYDCHKANSKGTWLGSWVDTLRTMNATPEFIIIEEGIDRTSADESELFWIHYFHSLGAKLLNTAGIPEHHNWSSNTGSKRPTYEECNL
jgi:hypothetical protein